jgi:hypothetical protein
VGAPLQAVRFGFQGNTVFVAYVQHYLKFIDKAGTRLLKLFEYDVECSATAALLRKSTESDFSRMRAGIIEE